MFESLNSNAAIEAFTVKVSGAAAGQTTRIVDAWGRQRWTRLDADGRLVEVVEPNPTGDGTVATSGLVTTYGYDTLGNLTQVNQGAQQRKFKYDSLRRLTFQKLAEESATLNDSGTYVPSGGTWSEAFSYDERSNLITQTDARGVKTIYSYNSDPLNRMQAVTYDAAGFGDTTHPILPAAGLTYEYMTSGDKTRLYRVTTAGVSTDEYGYDGEGRVSSRTLTMTSRASYPMVTDYIYDTLNRVTDVHYPAQYGVAGNPRKVAHQDYDVSSRLSGLKVDGADYASLILYNAASQTTSLKVGASGANQITESYQYDDMTGLLSNQKVQRGAASLMDLGYEYLRTGTSSGRTGQVTKILNNLNHNRDRGYEYDALGRLKRATGGQSTNWTQDYVYDRYGNRTSVTASGNTASNTTPRETLHTDQLLAFDPRTSLPNDLRDERLRTISDVGFSLTPASSPTTAAQQSLFDDVPTDHPYYFLYQHDEDQRGDCWLQLQPSALLPGLTCAP